jgi:DeoR/GlpR family transcriptional regulator of sugar metabolism
MNNYDRKNDLFHHISCKRIASFHMSLASKSSSERRGQLVELVRKKGFASLPELADELSVSQSTIRRDLAHLERDGATRRTHGGVLYAGGSPGLPHFQDRQSEAWERKKLIADRTAEEIEDGDTLLLDGGSTTYEVARRLFNRRVQIVTNSLPVANLFSGSTSVELILVGGIVHGRTGVTVGPYANEIIGKLNVRRTIMSVAAVAEDGYYNSNLLLVETEQAMIAAADEVIVVADSGKFGHRSLARLGELALAGRLVSDEELSAEWQDRLAQAGVEVAIARAAAESGDSP